MFLASSNLYQFYLRKRKCIYTVKILNKQVAWSSITLTLTGADLIPSFGDKIYLPSKEIFLVTPSFLRFCF